MKESYHTCFTSHDEVMFRDEEDHGTFVNLLALRAFEWGIEVLADAEMSTHVHLGIVADEPKRFAAALRMSYTKYFNRKYGREGRMGEYNTFILKVIGFVHQMILLNYILRNGLHHAAATTAFGYPYCSVRELFTEEIGFTRVLPAPMSRAQMASLLPRHAAFPDHYRMDADGVFLRSSFMEIRKAEQYYASPRNYLYQMNRLTDDSWIQEQSKDLAGAPLSIADIEHADEQSVAQMLKNESGRYYQANRMQDPAVCRLIDKELLPSYGAPSVYLLTDTAKKRIARQLFYDFHLSEQQIRRCLAIPR